MKNEKGFSLIELLIVVAIILIIAAIAVPNLLKSKMAANEASAAASLRTIATAEVTYSSTYNIGFSGNLAMLGPPAAGSAVASSTADLLDATLADDTAGSATKSGYNFTYAAGPTGAAPTNLAPNATWSVVAAPVSFGSSGQNQFCTDQTNRVGKDTTDVTAGSTIAPAAAGCNFAAAAAAGVFVPL